MVLPPAPLEPPEPVVLPPLPPDDPVVPGLFEQAAAKRELRTAALRRDIILHTTFEGQKQGRC
jgi:hypothetical protein